MDKIDELLQQFEDRPKLEFDDWFKLYNRQYKVSNDNDDENYRQKKYEFLPQSDDENKIYKKLKYWPDKDNLDDYIIFFGTEINLIYMIQMYDLSNQSKSEIKSRGNSVSFKWYPQIKLYFRQPKGQALVNNKSRQYAELSLRIMTDETDLSKSEISAYAQRIHSNLASYKWDKGKVTVSYKDKESGLENWLRCRTKPNGIELVQKLLAILNKTYKPEYVHVSESEGIEPDPQPIRVLGEDYTPDKRKPIIDVVFYKAELLLPRSGQVLKLIDNNAIVYGG